MGKLNTVVLKTFPITESLGLTDGPNFHQHLHSSMHNCNQQQPAPPHVPKTQRQS